MRLSAVILGLSLAGLVVHGLLRWWIVDPTWLSRYADWPLYVVLWGGGAPLVVDLLAKLAQRQFGSDLLAGLSIVTSVMLHEYLAGAVVVLMLSGGATLEAFAVRRARNVLEALAKRMPTLAHRKLDGRLEDVSIDAIVMGDQVVVFPHESCPVDGTVTDGQGSMDESFLTGEPYRVSKAPGASVISGAINGETALTLRAEKPARDSRYAQIMQVMRESEQHRPRMRRLGDQLGAIYTPIAIGLAALAWWSSGESLRFLAVLVVATPCPLLIAIPVAIIGSISLAARRGIIIRDPVVLEKLNTCRVAIFDKTGTLTYGQPELTEVLPAPGFTAEQILRDTASLERYSKHPLATAVLQAAKQRQWVLCDATEVREPPGQGLQGLVNARHVTVTHRKQVLLTHPDVAERLPPIAPGMECLILVDQRYAGVLRFRDQPRQDSHGFVAHLRPKHRLQRIMLLSGDRASEVQYLAELVGIREVFASQTPQQKLELVRRETAQAPTMFVGDGINDAPSLAAATVGIAMGNNDVTSAAAGAVIMESSIAKVDELLHLAAHLRRVVLQSAVGGMLLSLVGMLFAAAGWLPPVTGALIQEAIDVLAVLNALRTSRLPNKIVDF